MRNLDLDGNPTAGTSNDAVEPLPEGVEIQPGYQRAVACTEKLSRGVDYARFDFMWNGRELYGGEITIYPAAGVGAIKNPVTHAAIMDGWDLSCSHFLRTTHSGLMQLYANALQRLA